MKSVYGWAGVRYVITKFSRMDSLPNFLTHGAPLRARFARARSSAKIVLDQSHRIATEISLRLTGVLNLFITKDAVDYIILLDQ